MTNNNEEKHMIQYSDYHRPSNEAYAAIDGKLVPLADAAPKLATNAMRLVGKDYGGFVDEC